MKFEFEIDDTLPPVGFDFIEQMRLMHQLANQQSKNQPAGRPADD